MTYVITQRCCNDASCVAVCPVDCIRPRPEDPEFTTAEQLYIDPATCIDCAACVWECPVSAIYDENDIPEEAEEYTGINAEYFEQNPLQFVNVANAPRRRLPEGWSRFRVAVIGAGASGCYAAEELAQITGVEVSVFDKLPTPFGLVRSGVAPDHQETKGVTKQFERTLKRANVTSFLNLEVGADISIEEIRRRHHAVIIAYGASSDRKLDIPGEALPGSYSAREFVSWYNGSPSGAQLDFDLSGQRVVIIGNGNVSLDAARTLAIGDQARGSDIADYAAAKLAESGVEEIVIAARRGPDAAAFTGPELRALVRTPGLKVRVLKEEVDQIDDHPETMPFGTAKKLDLLRQASADYGDEGETTVGFRFGLEPLSIEGGADGVTAVTFRRGSVLGEDEVETIEASLVLRAIGYRSVPFEGVPFDDSRGTIPNEQGVVVDPETGSAVPGLFCVGWAKRGPSGVIGTNKWCAKETVDRLIEACSSGELVDPDGIDDDVKEFVSSLKPDYVDYEGWRRIDAYELDQARGAGGDRPRDKVTDIFDMVTLATAGNI